jgi:hypothetical protein
LLFWILSVFYRSFKGHINDVEKYNYLRIWNAMVTPFCLWPLIAEKYLPQAIVM